MAIPILDFIHLMVTIFSFDHMTGENREYFSLERCYSIAGLPQNYTPTGTKSVLPKILAKAGTRTVRSGVQPANHEATTPPQP